MTTQTFQNASGCVSLITEPDLPSHTSPNCFVCDKLMASSSSDAGALCMPDVEEPAMKPNRRRIKPRKIRPAGALDPADTEAAPVLKRRSVPAEDPRRCVGRKRPRIANVGTDTPAWNVDRDCVTPTASSAASAVVPAVLAPAARSTGSTGSTAAMLPMPPPPAVPSLDEVAAPTAEREREAMREYVTAVRAHCRLFLSRVRAVYPRGSPTFSALAAVLQSSGALSHANFVVLTTALLRDEPSLLQSLFELLPSVAAAMHYERRSQAAEQQQASPVAVVDDGDDEEGVSPRGCVTPGADAGAAPAPAESIRNALLAAASMRSALAQARDRCPPAAAVVRAPTATVTAVPVHIAS